MYKIGIVGGSGYTAGELIRILIHHPKVEIKSVLSSTNAGKKISSVHGDLLGSTEQCFTSELSNEIDILFLCLGHGNSTEFLKNNEVSKSTKIIDLSTDFRAHENSVYLDRTFIYGLPELNKKSISAADNVANPGCFATAIQLGLSPLSTAGLLTDTAHIHALTGSTGAGVKPNSNGHFSHRCNNISWYKAFDHQHLIEIKQSLNLMQEDKLPELLFLPIRGNFTRGIFATMYTSFAGSTADAIALFKKFYTSSVFTVISEDELHLKQVVNTNFCYIHLMVKDGRLLITSILDNLLKGAAGQAVQNMNLMLGLDEKMGLNFKASYF